MPGRKRSKTTRAGFCLQAEIQPRAAVLKGAQHRDPAQPAEGHRKHAPENFFVFNNDGTSRHGECLEIRLGDATLSLWFNTILH